MLRVALYQPDIAGNVGTIIRSCVCFDAELHIIEPCGFPFDLKRIRRSAMDYFDHAKIIRHACFEDFYQFCQNQDLRLILLTTKSEKKYQDVEFKENDIFLFGSESSGVPRQVAEKCQEKVKIEMKNNMRCLNVAISCGIILANAAI